MLDFHRVFAGATVPARMLSSFLLAVFAGIATPDAQAAPAEFAGSSPEIVRESVYNYLIISRKDSVVRFRRMENGATVSAIDVSHPKRQVIPYTATLFAAALVKREPRVVLNIGLGAGAFNRLFEPTFTSAKLTTVEIDSMILEVAEAFTAFRQDERNQVVLNDGRRYLLRSQEKWDWIVLDAYIRNSQVPPHLTTLEFYQLVKTHLRDDGVFVVNLHYGNALYQSHLKTLRTAFPQVALLGVPGTGNIIVMAVKYRQPELMRQIAGADLDLLPNLAEWGVDFAAMKKAPRTADEVALPRGVKILTDEFAPVEFLDVKPMQ